MTGYLDTFVYAEHKIQDIENNIDPENNLLGNINNSCRYHTENQYNTTIKSEHNISIIHFNSRSLNAAKSRNISVSSVLQSA